MVVCGGLRPLSFWPEGLVHPVFETHRRRVRGIRCRTQTICSLLKGIEMPNYPSDLTDRQWKAVCKCIPPGRPVGVPRQVTLRAVVDAIRYRQRSGCAWRLLPHDFPHWRTVYGYDRQWQSDGTWRRIEQALRDLRLSVSENGLASHSSGDQMVLVGDAIATSL